MRMGNRRPMQASARIMTWRRDSGMLELLLLSHSPPCLPTAQCPLPTNPPSLTKCQFSCPPLARGATTHPLLFTLRKNTEPTGDQQEIKRFSVVFVCRGGGCRVQDFKFCLKALVDAVVTCQHFAQQFSRWGGQWPLPPSNENPGFNSENVLQI